MRISFTVPGPPRTKKTSNRIVRAGRFHKVLPSKAFEEWNRVAQMHLANRSNLTNLGEIGLALPWRGAINCCATFYRQAAIGDATGFYQALADALQEAGIVENDRLLVSWDGSRLKKDAKNPRIEVVLTEATE